MKQYKSLVFSILSTVFCLGFYFIHNTATAQNGLYGEYYKGTPQTRATEVLWSEDWTGGSANQTPAQYMAGAHSGTVVYGGGTVSYSSTDGSSGGTKLYNEALSGGTTPELLLGKGGGTWTVSGIPTGGASSMSLTFLSNNGINEISATNGVTVSNITTSSRSCTLSNPNGATTFDLTFTRSNSSNTRIDNFVLTAEINTTPYNLTVDPGITNGSITLSHYTATEGTTITVTATPAAGYRLGHISYTPAGGSETIISGTSFSMPGADVVVSATFILEGTDGFEKVTEALTDWSGDYILAYKGNGYLDGLSSINTSGTSFYGNHIDILQYLHADNITVDANATTLGMVIHIEPSNGYYTLYLTGSGYLGYDTDNSGSNAQAKSLTCSATVSSNKYRWTITFIGGAVVITNAATTTRMLQYDIYNTPRKYACYDKNSNVVNADLYKYYETVYSISAAGGTGISGVTINGENVSQKDIPSGKTVTLTATTSYCYGFLGWYDANTNTLVSTDNPYVFTSSEDVNLIARTEALTEHTYTLNINVTGGGSVAINGNNTNTYSLTSCEQPTVTLTATPNDVSWSFDGWYLGNTLVSGATPYDYTIPEGTTILTARFSARSIYIDPPSGAYPAGTVVTIMTNPSAAFRYTTDGSTPTNASASGNGSTTYVLTTSTTVSAALTSAMGNVTSETYIVPKQKDPEEEAEGLHLNKYLNGNFDNNCSNPNTDCSYAYGNGQITLESYTTASVEAAVTNEPTDFIFVLDYSDMMLEDFESGVTRLDAMKNAVSDFLVTLSNNPSAYDGHNHRVGFVTFNSWGYLHYRNPNNDQLMYFYHEIDDQPTSDNINGTGWQRFVLARSNCLFSFGDPTYDPFWAWSLLKDAVIPSSGNMPDRAMAMIEDVFNYNGSVDYTFTANGETKTRRRIIITFTDGVPGKVTSHNGDWTFPSVANDACDYTTMTGSYSTPVANKTLSYMSELKSDYGAISYTIGILPGADGTGALPNYQESDGSYNYYIPSEPELTLNANRFLHLLSSNSETASDLCSNDWSNKSFYIAANNLDELDVAFSNIAANVTPDIALSTEGIVQDIMSEYFVIPSTTQETDIQVYTQEFLGLDGTDTIWGPLVPINVTIRFSPDHKIILETGYDYEANAVYLDESTTPPTPHGNKLVILVPIVFETTEDAVCGTYPTNDWVSGVFDGTGEPLAEFNNPMADVRYGKKEKTIEATACDSYTWHGTTYTAGGTYQFDTLASNGCDSTVYLNLTINHSEDVVLDPVSACNSYTWHGVTYTTSQTLSYDGFTAEGCPRHETMSLTINKPNNLSYTVKECETYTWAAPQGNGQTYTTSGTYTYSHEDANGCTQVDTLHLTINSGTHNVETETACETYTWHNTAYTTSGTYTYPYTNAAGCPSVDTLHLTINNGTHNVETEVACDTYTWHNTAYNASGTYTYSYTNSTGCPSVDTLHLTINNGTHNVETETACETYTWHNTPYTETGVYVYEYDNNDGCASADTLHLTINHGTHNIESVTANESYIWHNEEYVTSGIYVFEYENEFDCPSADTLHLTVNYGTHNTEVMTVCDSVEWNGVVYNTTGVYTYEYLNETNSPSVDTLILTVNYSTTHEFDDVSCDTYTWNDTVYAASSDYEQMFQTVNGCDSTVTLHLTINNSVTHEFDDVACDSYTWNNETYDSTGDYEQLFQTVNGCDSTVTLHLTINNSITHEFDDVACDSYTWNNETYDSTGDYEQLFQTVNGCDSTVTLHLTINNSVTHEFDDVACDSYTWNNETYDSTGDYEQMFQTINGCDSTVTLHLTINNSITHEFDDVACDSYTWNNETYDSTGDYEQMFQTVNGCDSTVTLHLTINNSVTHEFEDVACDSYTWNNETYDSTGDYEQMFQTVNGCDSTVTLHLTINNSVTHEFDTIACELFSWNGQSYTESGVYAQTLSTTTGCDSIVTAHVTIGHNKASSLEIETCDSYTLGDSTFTETGVYDVPFLTTLGCDSIVTLTLTLKYSPYVNIIGETNPVGGSETSYSVYHYFIEPIHDGTEIDSVVWYIDCPNWHVDPIGNGEESDLYIHTFLPNDSVALSATVYNSCGSVTTTIWLHTSYYGTDENDASNSDVSIMPNPNNGDMRIRFDNISGNAEIRVYDLLGNILDHFRVNVSESVMVMPYTMKTRAEASYYFLITTEQGVFSKKVVTVRQ